MYCIHCNKFYNLIQVADLDAMAIEWQLTLLAGSMTAVLFLTCKLILQLGRYLQELLQVIVVKVR
jgi:hypothetical protein